MFIKGGLLLSMLIVGCYALYSPSDDVYDLTPTNFQQMVLDSHFVWIVEFYAPWYVLRNINFTYPITICLILEVWPLSGTCSRVQESCLSSEGDCQTWRS